MLTIAIPSVIAYIITGYGIGKIANKEYFDNTPTEELGLFRKAKRLLLFPISYHHWSKRLDLNTFQDSPCMRKSHSLSDATEEIKKHYCQITTFLWPLKLIPALVGAVEILYFGIPNTACGLSEIPTQGTKYLGTGIKSLAKVKRKILPASSRSYDLPSQIDEVESSLGDITKQRNSLSGQKTILEKEIRQLSIDLNNWQTFLSQSKPENPDYVQLLEVTKAIAKEMNERRKKIDNLTEIINIFSDRERQLQDCVAKLIQCKKTMTLGIPITSSSGEGLLKDDSIAVLTRATITSTQSYIAECQELLAKLV